MEVYTFIEIIMCYHFNTVSTFDSGETKIAVNFEVQAAKSGTNARTCPTTNFAQVNCILVTLTTAIETITSHIAHAHFNITASNLIVSLIWLILRMIIALPSICTRKIQFIVVCNFTINSSLPKNTQRIIA